jgi:hypothetical protein
MPATVRPDFVRSHDDVLRRVRNLETGVHPSGVDVTIYADVARTVLTDESSLFSPTTSGALSLGPYYQKRAGSVSIAGQVTGTIRDIPAGGEKYGTLPVGVRPAQEETFVKMALIISADGTTVSYHPVLIKVKTNGELLIVNEFGIASPLETRNDSQVFLAGIVYPAA